MRIYFLLCDLAVLMHLKRQVSSRCNGLKAGKGFFRNEVSDFFIAQ